MRAPLRTGALVVAVLVVLAAGYAGYRILAAPMTVTAHFASATAIYPGDDVRIAGVEVGTIASIDPDGDTTTLTLDIDRGVSVPSDASAVIVAQSLVAARYVQLTPSNTGNGPTMADGADIPLERTAIPMEWDDIKEQLDKLANAVGPSADSTTGTLGMFIDSAADAMDGNGQKLKDMLTQLAGSAKILSDKRTDIFGTIVNLQKFVEALSASGEQIVQFEDRLASVSDVLASSTGDLDYALNGLSSVVVNLQRFVSDNADSAVNQVGRLQEVTQVLADNKQSLEQVLHVAPNGLANYNNIYNPVSGAAQGAFILNNFANPMQAICSAVGSISNATAEDAANLCKQYLGPVLSTLSINSLPVPVNPVIEATPPQDRLVYSEESVIPEWAKNLPPGQPQPRTIDDLLAPLDGSKR